MQVSIDSGPLQPVVYGDVRTRHRRRVRRLLELARRPAATTSSTGRRWPTASHTIGWLITDDCNRADGVGSRFFNVTTGTSLTAGEPSRDAVAAAAPA